MMHAKESASAAQEDGWGAFERDLDQRGWALLPFSLGEGLARQLAQAMKKVPNKPLAGFDLGRGDSLTLAEVPKPLLDLANQAYKKLVPIAQKWQQLISDPSAPTIANARRELKAEEVHATGTRLFTDDFVALHSAGDEQTFFPIQLVMDISEPSSAYRGGHLVLTEQRPRMQSKPTVVPIRPGDIVAIPVRARPFEGRSGYYRVVTRQAVSRVEEGERLGVEVFFAPRAGR